MRKLELAYKLGFDAAKNNKECIPCLNSDLIVLIEDLKVGDGYIEIIKEFRRGVFDGLGL